MYTPFSIGFNVDHMRISGTERNYNVFITIIVIATLQNSFKAHFFQKGMQNRGEHHKCLINEEAMHPKAVSENYFWPGMLSLKETLIICIGCPIIYDTISIFLNFAYLQ